MVTFTPSPSLTTVFTPAEVCTSFNCFKFTASVSLVPAATLAILSPPTSKPSAVLVSTVLLPAVLPIVTLVKFTSSFVATVTVPAACVTLMFLSASTVTLSPALINSLLLPDTCPFAVAAVVKVKPAALIAFATSVAVAKASPAVPAVAFPSVLVNVDLFTEYFTLVVLVTGSVVTAAVVPVPSAKLTVSVFFTTSTTAPLFAVIFQPMLSN